MRHLRYPLYWVAVVFAICLSLTAFVGLKHNINNFFYGFAGSFVAYLAYKYFVR